MCAGTRRLRPLVRTKADYGYGSRTHRRAAHGPRHLVLLDRRQREVLGEDGGAHRGQRQPAHLCGLAAARPPLRDARRDHPAGMSSRDGARPVRAVDGQCEQPVVPGVPGDPTGIVGLRRFPNPKFDKANWNAESYFKHPGRSSRRTSSGWRAGSATSASTRSTRPRTPKRRSGRTLPAPSAISTGRKAGSST